VVVSAKLIEKVDPAWWDSDEGKKFLHRDLCIDSWIAKLNEFQFDCFFTLTYKEPADSSILAIDRAARMLTKNFKKLKIPLCAFVAAEPHRSGLYHCHGLLKLGGLCDWQKKLILTDLWKVGYEMYGRCSFEVIEDAERVRAYVSKYLLKSECDWRFVP